MLSRPAYPLIIYLRNWLALHCSVLLTDQPMDHELQTYYNPHHHIWEKKAHLGDLQII